MHGFISQILKQKVFLYKRHPLASNTSLVGGFISWHNKVKPFFKSKKWILAISLEPLLTSSRPVILIDTVTSPVDLHILGKTTVLFAINSKLLLIGLPNPDRSLLGYGQVAELSYMQSFNFNLRIFKSAIDIIIAQDLNGLNTFFSRQQLIVSLIFIINKRINDLAH